MRLEKYAITFELAEDVPDDKWDDLYIALEDLDLQDTIESFIEDQLFDAGLTDIIPSVK